MGLPLVVHSRDAVPDTAAILKESLPKDHKVHLHYWSGNWQVTEDLLDHFPNLYVGFGMMIEYSGLEDLQEVVRRIPLSRVLLESDGPYIPPLWYRHEDAAPAHMPYVAKLVATMRQETLEATLRQVRRNTKELYGI